MMYKILAWTSVVLLFYNFSLFPLRRLLKKFSWSKRFLFYGSKIHRFTGIALLFTGSIHGYLALGTVKLHTGSLLWLGILTLFSIYLFRKILKRKWLSIHRWTDFIVIAMFFVHFFFPWLI
ncbi:hypothetical protein [Pseudothermotoga sp.]|uniref:hypothetical protein n=1 Tax=Pseudothermotoga sp. TaxID=2033661 RepID=UPI0031F6CCD8